VLALVAQVTPWKGQEEAIRAAAVLRDRGRDVRLLLVGTTKFDSAATRYDNRAYLARLESLVRELGLDERVVFGGERNDVPLVMRASDALLVPSWAEPFGRTVIEGMAIAVPVVATNVGGPAEIVSDGRDGLLVEPRRPELWADAVERLIAEPGLRERLAAGGRSRARDFDRAVHVAQIVGCYEELLGEPPERARRQAR
jgi:glycosyltransferase involved in cell wall biosynthesis